MATFTITTDVNNDTLTSKAGADTYNVNGYSARYTIDGDVRNDLNGGAAVGALGNVTPSATLGGTARILGTESWLIPYNTGSGNVPVSGTVISKGSASGKLVAVYSALNVAPTASGAAMPASGYIKVKQWNGTNYGTGALTGIGASAVSGEKYGWVEVVGQDASTWQPSRLNQVFGGVVQPTVRAKWFEIGTTDGNRATTYQIPTNGVNQYHPGVYVDAAAPVSVTGVTWSGGIATYSATAHGLHTGQVVVIEGISPNGYNTDAITAEPKDIRVTVLDANTFTLPISVNPGSYSSGGTVNALEFYPVTSDTATSDKVATDATRGKWCWIDVATGLLRFGHDGTNLTGGYIVPSGRKIRIGNVFLASCTSGAKNQNALNATVTSRYRLLVTSAGSVDIDKASSSWNLTQFITAYQVIMTNTGSMSAVGGTGPWATRGIFYNVGVGNSISSTQTMVGIAGMPLGADIYDCVFGGGAANSKIGVTISGSSNGIVIVRSKFISTGEHGTGLMVSASIASNIEITDCTIGCGGISFSQVVGVNTITNLTYFSSAFGIGAPTNSAAIIALTNNTFNCIVNGVTNAGLVGQGARSNFVTISGGSSSIKIRNVGTNAAPWDGRDSNGYVTASWTRSGTVATINKTAHGLKVGDWFVATWSSSIAAITAAPTLKTVATVVDADNFTVACLNAGAASGTMGYMFTALSVGISIASGSTDITVQNFHLLGHQGQLVTNGGGNTSLHLENMTSDTRAVSQLDTAANNLNMDSAVVANRAISVTAAIYGTSFLSQFLTPYNTSYSSTGAAWTRSGATITVVTTNHNLTPGDRVWVSNSSDAAATSWGLKAVTIVDKDTYTYTGVAAGAASGTLNWQVPDARSLILMNEKNTLGDYYTIDVGSDIAFTGAGTLSAPTVNNQITWTTPRFITGFDSFAPIQPEIVSGTLANYELYYDLDTGSGFSGSFKNLNYPRAGGGGSASSTNVTMTDTTGVAVGDFIYGQGIAYGAKVQSITNSTTVVATIANVTAVTGTLYFSQLPNTSTLPSTGYKMKVRLKTIVTNTSAITGIVIYAQSTNTSRNRLYSQLDEYTLTLTGLVSGSDIVVLDAGTEDDLANVDANAGTTYAYDYGYEAGSSIDIGVFKAGYKPFYIRGYALTADDATLPIAQVVDRDYLV